jgi:NAD-dependent deacetylase
MSWHNKSEGSYQNMTNEIEPKLVAVATELRQAKRVLFITGAGISADSGLPTYRGVGGLYNTETTEEGYPIEQCLSASMFRVRPDITWKYMFRIGEAVIQRQPNPAHIIIARWEKIFAGRDGKAVVFTQNIDGYHRLAGSENVLEIHGNLGELFCTKCSWETYVDLSTDNRSSLAERLKEYGQDSVPRCPKCRTVIRPRIVMFEEMLPRPVLTQFSEEFDNGNGVDMVFSIGTSAMFPYITDPVYTAIHCGKTTVEINPTVGELSHKVTYHLPMGAADALTRLDALMVNLRNDE